MLSFSACTVLSSLFIHRKESRASKSWDEAADFCGSLPASQFGSQSSPAGIQLSVISTDKDLQNPGDALSRYCSGVSFLLVTHI